MRAPLLVLALALSRSANVFAAEAPSPSTPSAMSGASTGSAQPAAPAPAASPSAAPTLAPSIQPSIFAPKMPRLPPRDSAPRSRAMSPEMASKLGVLVNQAVAALPPPPPKPPEAQDEGSSDALRMDPFIVEDERPPDLKERHVLTKKGTEALMKKQYPALKSLGPIPLFNGVMERAIREDDLRKERAKEMQELSGRAQPLPQTSDPRFQPGTPFRESR